MAEKSEKATPKKLRDARKKGQVAKSQDFPTACTFITSVAITLSLIGYLYGKLGNFVIAVFQQVAAKDLTTAIPSLFLEGFSTVLLTVLPISIVVALVGVIVTFLTVGPTWAPEVFKFDIKKFDPFQNLKAKFKMKTVIELLKQLFKIGVSGYIIYRVVYKSIPVLTKLVGLPLIGALIVFHAFLMEVIIKVGLFFIVIAIFDLIYQKRVFAKEMKMEKFEVKQEYKNTEGDPMIKGKRRQIAQEIAYSSGPVAGVQQAQAVVTNPTHLAIAIGYEKDVDAAPYILAMGEGFLAEQIIKIAEKLEVPIMRNIPLAHKLWEEGNLYEYVPEDTYEAMAEILRWVASLQEDVELSSEVEL